MTEEVSRPRVCLLIAQVILLLPGALLAFPSGGSSSATSGSNQRSVTQQPLLNYPPSHAITQTNSNNNKQIYKLRSEQQQRPRLQTVIPVPKSRAVQSSAGHRTPAPKLSVQESRRHSNRDEYEAPPPAPLPPHKPKSTYPPYDYDDPYADIRAMGDAQYSQSHLINDQKKSRKKTKKKNRNNAAGGKKGSTSVPPVHRYPTEPASQESQPIERYPQYTDLPDEGYLESMGSGPEAYPDEMTDSEVSHYQPAPSNDYADEADGDYDEDGYEGDHDDDDDDDSSESRSKTYVASGTGPIPPDMKAYGEDDTFDPVEAAADAFISERERDADRSIDYYKKHEAHE